MFKGRKYKVALFKAGAFMLPATGVFLNISGAVTARPNIIFILLDDFGYSDAGCYGSRFYETPNIDELARKGLRFTDAYAACPVSSPTRAAIMTGLYPVKTGITDWIPGRQASNMGSPDDKLLPPPLRNELDLNKTTIAEVLKRNGYATMISGKWHLGMTPDYWPENQGFDVNKGGFSAGSPVRSGGSKGYFSPYGNPRLQDGPEGEYLTDRQTEEAIRFIESSLAKPFFLYLSYYAVHNPMQCKEELIRKFTRKADSLGLSSQQAFTRERQWIRHSMNDSFRERIVQSNPVYAAMIFSVDENLGRLFRRLAELDLDRNTIIIFTSDNGGLSTSAGSPTSNHPLRAGKGWLYEGGIRVPLIIKAPGKTIPGSVAHSPVSSIDFFPTIVEMSGSADPGMRTDGVSLVPLFRKDKMKERPLFWHYPHYNNTATEPGSAVRLGNYKLFDNFERKRLELYDLESDLSEQNDISSENPAKVKELFGLLQEWREKSKAAMMIPNPAWEGPY